MWAFGVAATEAGGLTVADALVAVDAAHVPRGGHARAPGGEEFMHQRLVAADAAAYAATEAGRPTPPQVIQGRPVPWSAQP